MHVFRAVLWITSNLFATQDKPIAVPGLRNRSRNTT